MWKKSKKIFHVTRIKVKLSKLLLTGRFVGRFLSAEFLPYFSVPPRQIRTNFLGTKCRVTELSHIINLHKMYRTDERTRISCLRMQIRRERGSETKEKNERTNERTRGSLFAFIRLRKIAFQLDDC